MAASSGSTPMADGDSVGGGAAVGPDTAIGASASSPVDVDDSPTASTAKTARRARATRSDVWKEMEEVKKVVGGKEVRVGAVCNYCKSRLSAPSTGGTGHLRRHIRACKRKALAASSSSQSHLHFDGDGNVRRFQYNANVARSELCRLIARLDLPLNIGEQPAWEDYIRNAHNPDYKHVSRQTTTRDLEALFGQKQVDVKELLNTASCVCLISDTCSGNAKEDYLSVVFHFITDDWELEKRIVGMRLIDCSHSGVNIAERILQVVSEYGMISKVFSITLDNASANAYAMTELTPKLVPYVCGSANVAGLMHQRCACHIINLIVKSGLKRIKEKLEDFRRAISWLNSSNQRIASFKSFCIAHGIRPRKFGLDMDVRWNATYLMLKHLMPYKNTFSVYVSANYQVGGEPLLTEEHWYVAEHMLKFLGLFYLSTVSLSGVYYPTSPLMMHAIIEIADHLNQFENDDRLREVVVPMKTKFIKYWGNIPLLYSYAFILDPRAKLNGFTKALQFMSESLNRDYSAYYQHVKTELSNLFCRYEIKFGGVRLQRPPQPLNGAGKKVCSWNRLFGSGSGVPAAPSPASASPSAPTFSHPQVSELTNYLDSDPVSQFDDSFNILSWWHDHKRTYPVLSILAKDILTVPVSTISSESAFSLCGRVLEERRRSLSPEHVEMVSLIKDWEQGDARQQHNMENKELEERMANLYLDGYRTDGPTSAGATGSAGGGGPVAGATPDGTGSGSGT